MTVTEYPRELEKKMKLLTYFKRYMTEHLVKAGGTTNIETDEVSRPPHLHTWFRTTCAVVMHLTNGSVQVIYTSSHSMDASRPLTKSFCFLQLNFSDHIKIILCPRMSAVTYIDQDKQFRTFKFSTISTQGCSIDLYQKLRYAHEKLKKLLEKLN